MGTDKSLKQRYDLLPPGQATQIGLTVGVTSCGKMHACELMANRCAMRGLRLHIGAPWQTADKGGRLSGEAAESMAQAVRNRFGAGNAMRCQV